MPKAKKSDGMWVKATRRGHSLYLREEGAVFFFVSVKGNTAKVVENSSWLEPAKDPAPATEDDTDPDPVKSE